MYLMTPYFIRYVILMTFNCFEQFNQYSCTFKQIWEVLNGPPTLESTNFIMILRNYESKQKFHGSHLEFQDGHPIYKFGIAPIEFVELTNVGLYPKMMFL